MKLVPNECLLSDQVVRQAVCGAYHLPLSLLNGDSKEARVAFSYRLKTLRAQTLRGSALLNLQAHGIPAHVTLLF